MARLSMWAVPVAVFLAGAVVPGAAASAASAAGTRGQTSATAVAAPGSGQQAWAQRYSGPGGGADSARATAVSPDGTMMFVTGGSAGAASGSDYATVAYNAQTGAPAWTRRYNGPANGTDYAVAAAVTPDGSTVVVTGISKGRHSGNDYATVAYQATTGKWLWTARYNGPANRADEAVSLAAGPTRVVVTGVSQGTDKVTHYATVAYRAATGAPLWTRRYHGPGPGNDDAQSVAVSPGGSTVFVTGTSNGKTSHADYATLSYQAATGKQLWVSRYNSTQRGYGYDEASSLVVSPTGKVVYVTGNSHGRNSGASVTTVAYRASAGTRLWVNRYAGATPAAIAVNRAGTRVYVTGSRNVGPSEFSYVTISYLAGAGTRLWTDRYRPEGIGGIATSIAVSPASGTVYVTGFTTNPEHENYATIAYGAGAGTHLWTAGYDGPDGTGDAAVAVAATAQMVFVTGQSNVGPHSDYATVAYTP